MTRPSLERVAIHVRHAAVADEHVREVGTSASASAAEPAVIQSLVDGRHTTTHDGHRLHDGASAPG